MLDNNVAYFIAVPSNFQQIALLKFDSSLAFCPFYFQNNLSPLFDAKLFLSQLKQGILGKEGLLAILESKDFEIVVRVGRVGLTQFYVEKPEPEAFVRSFGFVVIRGKPLWYLVLLFIGL